MQLTVAQDITALQRYLIAQASQGRRMSLVPTMGALHEGHLSLIQAARQCSDIVVVSIFVNPTQFGKNEDFSKYPRMLEDDLKKVEQAGGHMVYAPTVLDMYPEGFSTKISVGHMGQVLCGAHRPGHFDGVATVVAKLLLRVLPHTALFGEKDYQQLCVIRKLVHEMDMPINIVGRPTIREKDGLAMSSRNVYLSKQEREIAPLLYKTLGNVATQIKNGTKVHAATQEARSALMAAGFKPDYLEYRTENTLEPLEQYVPKARLLVAAWLGNTRLIDNIEVE